MSYLSCYSFYDDKGRRISAFCTEKDGQLEIFMWYCSKRDQLYKRFSELVYHNWQKDKYLREDIHPEIIIISLPEESSAKYTFIKYLESRFYRKRTFQMAIPGQKITTVKTYNKGLPLTGLLYIETEEFYKAQHTFHGNRQPTSRSI